MIKNTAYVGPDIADILDSNVSDFSTRSKDIEAIIWPHHHFDRTGDPSAFPVSTTLVVGPDVKDTVWPGYPANQNGMVLDSDIQAEMSEISHSKMQQKQPSLALSMPTSISVTARSTSSMRWSIPSGISADFLGSRLIQAPSCL